MVARLYVMPASHPCHCVERALQLKDLEYERVDLLPGIHKLQQRLRFGQPTVPGIELDGERIVGSRRILRRLDALKGAPRLYPAKKELRERVEEAERWGDEVLQSVARRIIWGALRRNHRAMSSYAAGANLPVPSSLVETSAPLVARMSSSYNRASAENVRADIQALPGHLDRVDGWIEEGVLGGRSPNAADLQILSSIRLLGTIEDLQPAFAGRPCDERARRLFPDFPGNLPAGTLPADWLPAPGAVET